jgi:hypothetical protein
MAKNKEITVGTPHLTGGELIAAELIEKVLLGGDLSSLTSEERLYYYKAVCESLGLNPLTKPFNYIVLDKKLVLYATKDCTEQLRSIHDVSITDLTAPTKLEDVYVVTAKAKNDKGRTDAATGAVSSTYTDDRGEVHKFTGIGLANLLMKAETKAKRRVTLSICGLGMLDESELDNSTVPATDASSAILERNVKEAAAHAMGEPVPDVRVPAGIGNEYGPLTVTENNYKELISHIGKAQGEMLGKKVGDLHDNVIDWLYKKWREKLDPSASEQDMRLKKAIEFAYRKRIAGDTKSGGGADTASSEQGARERDPVKPPPDHPPFDLNNLTSKEAAIRDLRGRLEDLMMTEAQFCQCAQKFGVFGQGWETLDKATEAMLLYMCQPKAWTQFRELYEAEVKPKVTQAAKPKRKKKGQL